MNITFLIDNITKNELISEWGLSVYIEYQGHRILLDTGASEKFIANAETLDIDILKVEYGVLSHAHYDHANGLDAFFTHNSCAPFYIRSGAKENCYDKKLFFSKYIGIKKGCLEKYKDRIIYVDGDYEIVPGVTLIPHKTPGLEQIGKAGGMYVKENGTFYPDSFSHEQSLVFDTEKGLVIFNSCSHGGADNIIREVQNTYPKKKIYALVGGFHLFKTSEEKVRALAARIKDTGIQKIYTGHCTGQKALDILSEELGDQVEAIYTGMQIII